MIEVRGPGYFLLYATSAKRALNLDILNKGGKVLHEGNGRCMFGHQERGVRLK